MIVILCKFPFTHISLCLLYKYLYRTYSNRFYDCTVKSTAREFYREEE